MSYHLTVVQDFGKYKRGDGIDDPSEVARILSGEHEVHVVKVPLGTHSAAEASTELVVIEPSAKP